MREWTAAGADVSSKTLDLHVRTPEGREQQFSVPNTSTGHERLIRRLEGLGPVRIAMESTGVYGLDAAVALSKSSSVRVMVTNPRAARRFAEALMERSKTDQVDANSLCTFVERMPFEEWEPPREICFELRALMRRIGELKKMRTQEKCRLHAAKTTKFLGVVRNDIEVHIRYLDRRIKLQEAKALQLIATDPELSRAHRLLISIGGVADASAAQLLSELVTLADDMTARQWVAHSGLDPSCSRSGLSERPSRISKQGNAYLRAALYWPAQNAILNEPRVRLFYDRLLERGKEKMQAITAVMRKLLVAIYAMLKTNTDFDAERFTPTEAA